jgi:hypothetical protein
LFQDHRDGNLEAVGMTMVCCLHQAVPSRLQVIVSVRDIQDRGAVVRNRDPNASAESRSSWKCLPPTSASKVMRRSRSAWQRAVMSRRSCSRCRTRRRS